MRQINKYLFKFDNINAFIYMVFNIILKGGILGIDKAVMAKQYERKIEGAAK